MYVSSEEFLHGWVRPRHWQKWKLVMTLAVEYRDASELEEHSGFQVSSGLNERAPWSPSFLLLLVTKPLCPPFQVPFRGAHDINAIGLFTRDTILQRPSEIGALFTCGCGWLFIRTRKELHYSKRLSWTKLRQRWQSSSVSDQNFMHHFKIKDTHKSPF